MNDYINRLNTEIDNALEDLAKEDLEALYGTLAEIKMNILPLINNLSKEVKLLKQVITHDMTDNCDLDNLIYFLEDNGIIKVINHGRLQDKIDEWTDIIEEV